MQFGKIGSFRLGIANPDNVVGPLLYGISFFAARKGRVKPPVGTSSNLCRISLGITTSASVAQHAVSGPETWS